MLSELDGISSKVPLLDTCATTLYVSVVPSESYKPAIPCVNDNPPVVPIDVSPLKLKKIS